MLYEQDPALDKALQQENHNDEQNQSDSASRGIAPVPAMRPDGRHTEKRRNQDYDQYNPEHGSSSFCFVKECNSSASRSVGPIPPVSIEPTRFVAITKLLSKS